jgi:hypothetical protein
MLPHVSRVGGASAFGVKILLINGLGFAPGAVAAGEDNGGALPATGDPEVVNSPVASFFRAVPTAKKYFVPGFNPGTVTSCAVPKPPSARSVC